MRIERLALFLIALVIGATSSRAASAHTVGMSRGDYFWKDGTLWVGVAFARRELALAVPVLAGVSGDELIAFDTHRDDLGRWLVEHLSVVAGDAPCRGTFAGMRFDGDGLALAVAYECPGSGHAPEVEARFIAELSRGHRHLAVLSEGDDAWESVATADHPRLRSERGPEEPPARADPVFVSLLRMGIEHILTGYDHLLFLLGLVLVGKPIRSLFGAITAFTLAHSITLAISALGVWTPSPNIIEPCIALSIAYVGAENWFVRDASGRWKITFAFGLVHGFGFAGALREVALPPGDVPLLLFAFNAGVELGQVAVLAALLPLVHFARRLANWERVGMRTCTMAIALAGVVWFVARLQNSI